MADWLIIDAAKDVTRWIADSSRVNSCCQLEFTDPRRESYFRRQRSKTWDVTLELLLVH